MKRSSKVMVGVAAGVALVIGAAGGAVGAQLVTSAQIKNGTIQIVDLSPAVKKEMTKPGARGATGATGAKGANGAPGAKGDKGDPGDPASDVNGELIEGLQTASATTLAHIGGPFASNATTLGTFELDPGTYLINAYGFFDRIDNTQASSPILQLAVRNTAGDDYGTAFTGNFPSSGDREQTASSTRVVTVAAPTTVTVFGFGYNNDSSGTGSGNYTVKADVSVVQVG